MVITHIITHGLFFAVIFNGYILLLMVLFSPRVWGYADYPEVIKNKVPLQTQKEKLLAVMIALPWFIFLFGFPIFSTYMLKSKLGNEIPYIIAFLNLLILMLLANAGDLILLDWLIITKFTPEFVIIPGSERADYKDFSHHYRGHAKALALQILACLIIASIVWYFWGCTRWQLNQNLTGRSIHLTACGLETGYSFPATQSVRSNGGLLRHNL